MIVSAGSSMAVESYHASLVKKKKKKTVDVRLRIKKLNGTISLQPKHPRWNVSPASSPV